ncbi:hypothetical protein BT1A1_3480 [Caldibacillus thermoamylovorans]|uniref:Uncharacterized protein n=1 Tax=Caldibacillus thermoamylovorans TaxID=35841 RepID=A0A090IYT9_9BACI|nr:hypothetical protein [Caldibacillus thermoamylovorans]CEE03261.1 hypothetical protein BT1A1_3480 [Caldibacillus thermoamylovorans]
MNKILCKKAGVILIIMSILGLMGCGNDKYTAERIEKGLTEKYGGTFEVLALGNRYGTMTNDYVQANVKAVDSDIVFSAKMSPKGEILVDNYISKTVLSQLEKMLNSNLESEGITAKSMMSGFSKSNTSEVELGTPLNEFISKYKPYLFAGYLVIKESPNNTGAALTNAFQKTFNEIQNIELRANVWIIPEENYDEIVAEMSQLPDIDNSWFDDKETLSSFKFSIETDSVSPDENELNKLLQGGVKLD